MSTLGNNAYKTVIIGGGPAGTGPLIYSAWSGQLKSWMDQGIAIVERSHELCSGNLKNYEISSNTVARDFIDFMDHPQCAQLFERAKSSSCYALLKNADSKIASLPIVGEFLKTIGDDLIDLFNESKMSDVYLGSVSTKIKQLNDGSFEVYVADEYGEIQVLRTEQVLLATGGKPISYKQLGSYIHRLSKQGGAESSPLIMNSSEVITKNGMLKAEMWLNNFDDPQVVIVGGSHSAFSSAWVLHNLEDCDFEPEQGNIKIVHRSDIKVFYTSKDEASADGYMQFCEDDVCEKSGNVFYLGGLRGDAKELYRSIKNKDNDIDSSSIQLIQSVSYEEALQNESIDWESVAIVILAGGYEFHEIPIENYSGYEIGLQGTYNGSYVNQKSQVCDSFGNPIQGIYATGLGTGLSLTKFGNGEKSFSGQENSVWLCQNDLGESLFNTLAS